MHNFVCVALSLYTTIAFMLYMLYDADSIYSKRLDVKLQAVFSVYAYTKVFELLDTVYMMLRQSGRQVSRFMWHFDCFYKQMSC